MSALRGATEIRPEHRPYLIAVESVIERNARTGISKTVSRYYLTFPGSGFMNVIFKVEEDTPSVTPEFIAHCGGAVRVDIQGFTSGSFETSGEGARPYFKAEKIVPVQTQAQPAR